MREFAKKMPQSSARAARGTPAAAYTDVNPGSLKRLFHGWLREAPPLTEARPDTDIGNLGLKRIALPEQSGVAAGPATSGLEKVGSRKRIRTILTIRELLALNRATVREGGDHRHWPREVILKFLSAEVVTRKRERP